MKIIFSIVMFLSATICSGQVYVKPNEQVILSFKTNNGKQFFLVSDKTNSYIAYRFGTKDKIEFEFPDAKQDSWNKFVYAYYLRGGGVTNEGMDLNYVSFTNNSYRYTLYDVYYTVGEKQYIGVKVTNLKTNKTVDIKGIYQTKKGTLIDFRDNHLLKIDEELMD